MWRKRPNPRDGLSRNCARRETKFSQLGPPSAAEEGSGIQRQAGGEPRGKSSAGTPDWEKSKLGEQIFTQGRGGPQIRTFAESAPAECRGYSEALQRVMTDFGADDAFAGAAAKLKEHYGIEVAVSAVRGSTGGTRGHDAGRNQDFGETRG